MRTEALQILAFGPYRIDREQRLLTRGSCVTPLAPKIFDLLVVLAEAEGRTLRKETLIKQLWPDSFVEEGSLTRNISTLRKALGDASDDQKYVMTVPKYGYRFVAEVRPVAPDTQTAQIDSNLQIHSIAVSPLHNISGDPSQDYFAEVLSEALIGELARIHRLKVFSASAISKHHGAVATPSSSRSEPHVDMLIEGSVMRSDTQIRITLTAFHLPTQSQVWSQHYDRDLGEILAVQKEVASTIASQVRADLTPHERMQFNAARSVRPEAYDCYLRGRFYAQRQNKDDNETAILAFEHATALDPTFALAHAELAQTYVWKLFLFAPHERQWEEKAFVAVEKALLLDPHLAVTHLARGRLLWTPANRFPHAKAIREYRRALALNPNLDEARNQLALIYCHIGLFDEALREAQEAVLVNPANNLAVYRTAQTLAFQRKYEQAFDVLKTIPHDVNPSLIGYQTAWVLFNLDRNEEAIAMINQLLMEHPDDDGALFTSLQAVLAASSGNDQKARDKIQVAIQEGKGFGHFHHAAYHIAIAFALMRNAKQAVDWLEFASADGFPCYPLFEGDQHLQPLREDARYISFMAKLHVQWMAYRETTSHDAENPIRLIPAYLGS